MPPCLTSQWQSGVVGKGTSRKEGIPLLQGAETSVTYLQHEKADAEDFRES
jgi:hypothetical protein